MKVKFLREWRGVYGIFVQGRSCELSGPMLDAVPKDSYELVKEESAAKQVVTSANKQVITSVNKETAIANKGMESDGKSKKAKQRKEADS